MGYVEEFALPIDPLGQSPRTVWAYLPDGYGQDDRVYPVLYMFDGHNLFDDAMATYGKSWGIRDYLDRTGAQLVVIGQDCNHTGNKRLEEYCPYSVKMPHGIGKIHAEGRETADWFVHVLKPACEKRYRICSEREHVGIGGSSMGGLMSLYCVTRYNDVFGSAACISPAVSFCGRQLRSLIAGAAFADTRIYISMGSEEAGRSRKALANMTDRMLAWNSLLLQKGCTSWPRLIVGGSHDEATWETIVPEFMPFMFPEAF